MAADISERIKKISQSFTKSQRKIATAVLREYDKVAYMTAADFSRHVGVSESTVIRFANELGYEGYSEFKKAVEELVRIKLTPHQRIEITKLRMGSGDILSKVMESDIAKIRTTLEKINKIVFYNSVDAILSAKNIYIIGARSTEPLAKILEYNLSLIFDNVKLIRPNSTAEILEQLFSIGEDDVLIAFSFPRYSSKLVPAVKYAMQNRANIVVITDSTVSPIAEYSTFLLTAQSDMASFMDSFVAPLSIINAIIVEITNRREREIIRRFDQLEKVWDEYDVYTKR
jgi:DNA-binding MurR/RpiR family transcriptional regulator